MANRLMLGLLITLTILLFTFYLSSVKAQDVTTTTTTIERHTIVTPVPTAKETYEAPAGYVNCFRVSAGWYQDKWIPEHQVCQYTNAPQGIAWVDGYWACTKYTDQGICNAWEWKPAHWEQTLDVY